MRFYGNIEEANKEALQRAANYRKAAEQIRTVTEVVRQFDNKVYNCRLEKALKEATDNRVFCDKSTWTLEIYTYPEKGYSYRVNLACVKVDEMNEGKRIPADKLITSLQEHRETLLKQAFDIESEIDNMPYVKEYIKQTVDKLEAYCRSFNTDLRDIYGIPYCVRVD